MLGTRTPWTTPVWRSICREKGSRRVSAPDRHELPLEGFWQPTGVVGPPDDAKAVVSVWTPGAGDGDPGEACVDVTVTEPLTPAEAERLSMLAADAANTAREIAAWAIPLWQAANAGR